MSGILYLLPTPLGETEQAWLLSQDIAKIKPITHFIVEEAKTARRHLKLLNLDNPIQSLHFSILNEHTNTSDLSEMLSPLLNGYDVALMSEAGCPAVADPGAAIVALAHKHNIKVEPLVGPSSLLLALMSSGANGQSFAFNGYLPADSDGRIKALKNLERKALNGESQIFIETPYRNMSILNDAIRVLSPQTTLCIAADISLPSQIIMVKTIDEWKKNPLPDFKKRPCVFIVY